MGVAAGTQMPATDPITAVYAQPPECDSGLRDMTQHHSAQPDHSEPHQDIRCRLSRKAHERADQ